MTCAAEGCDRAATRRQMCEMHYRRFKRNGTPHLQAVVGIDHGDGTRTCSRCVLRKAEAQFAVDKRLSSGRRALCVECENTRRRTRYPEIADRVADQQREWRALHEKHVRDRRRRYYEANPLPTILAATQAVHRRRALLSGVAADAGISIHSLRARHGDSCPYCGTGMSFEAVSKGEYVPMRATIEHVIPVSRGGAHTWDNTILCCWRCNIRKNNRSEIPGGPLVEVTPARHGSPQDLDATA